MQNLGIFPLLGVSLLCLGQTPGDLSRWATVESHVNGEAVYAFGYTYVYAVSPDFQPNVTAQEGDSAPAQKIQPKKSWEIESNLFGSTPAREPRSAAYDDQPLLGVHLIDGDVRSCWASRGQNQPDYEEAWVRIDLPFEQQIGSVVLIGHPDGMGRADPRTGSVKVGQAFPRKLEIRTSRDAWHWQTVYRQEHYQASDVAGRNVIPFNPVEGWMILYWPIGGLLFVQKNRQVLELQSSTSALCWDMLHGNSGNEQAEHNFPASLWIMRYGCWKIRFYKNKADSTSAEFYIELACSSLCGSRSCSSRPRSFDV